jgi:hypothetical protein
MYKKQFAWFESAPAPREKEFKRTLPGFVPALEEGVTLYSALIYHRRAAGSQVRRTMEDVLGSSQYKHASLLFGPLAGIAGSDLQGGRVTSFEALRLHTLHGFYGRALDPSVEEALANTILCSEGVNPQKLFGFRSGPIMRTEEWCYCPDCVIEDWDQGNVPAWKVLHQLPLLTHCHIHRRQLIGRCNSCKVILERGHDWRLPGEPCRCCGSRQEITHDHQPISQGQASCGALSWRIFRGLVPSFRPKKWAEVVDAFVDRAGGIERAATIVGESIKSRWGVSSLDRLHAILGHHVSPASLQSELRLLSAPTAVATRLLVLDAIETLDGDDFIGELSKNVPEGAASELTMNPQKVLRSLLVETGFPAGVGNLVMSGVPSNTIEKIADVRRHSLSAFRRQLPRNIWRQIREQQPARLNSVVPIGLKKHEQREMFRMRLTAMLSQMPDVPLRSQARQHLPGPIAWLYKHDRKWLDLKLPGIRSRAAPSNYVTFEGRRAKYRADVERLTAMEPKIGRGDAGHRTAAVGWLRKNDADWLNEKLPSSRPMAYQKRSSGE